MSFTLNVQKKDARGQRLIQIELVKNIVPMALGGTLLGVMLNVYTPRAILVLCLACLLTFLSFKLVRQGMSAYKAENVARESIVDFNREIAIKSTTNQSDTVSTAASSTGSDAGGAPAPQQMNVDQPDTYFQGRCYQCYLCYFYCYLHYNAIHLPWTCDDLSCYFLWNC